MDLDIQYSIPGTAYLVQHTWRYNTRSEARESVHLQLYNNGSTPSLLQARDKPLREVQGWHCHTPFRNEQTPKNRVSCSWLSVADELRGDGLSLKYVCVASSDQHQPLKWLTFLWITCPKVTYSRLSFMPFVKVLSSAPR